MITVHYDDGGVQREIHLRLERLSDLNPVLRRFGRYLRAKAKDRFAAQGPGWEPLAVSTIERLQETRIARVTAHGKLRESYVKNLGHYLRQQVKAGKAKGSVLARLEQLASGRDYDPSSLVERRVLAAENALAVARNDKILDRLEKQLDKAQEQSFEERAHKGKRKIEQRLLGKLASSLEATVSGGTLVVRSKVPWAGVHNDGGNAGRGASIPARPFLFLEPYDMDVLEAQAIEYVEGKEAEERQG